MILDLRWSEDVIPAWRAEVDGLYEDIWQGYSLIVKQISIVNADSVDWWVSPLASRDEYKSPLFHYCCGLAVLRKKISEGDEPETVIVDSTELGDIVQRYFDAIGYPGLVRRETPGLIGLVQNWWVLIKQRLRFFHRIVLVRSASEKPASYPDQLVLIDTFSIRVARSKTGTMEVSSKSYRRSTSNVFDGYHNLSV